MNRNTVFSKVPLAFLILVLFFAAASLGTLGCAGDAAVGANGANVFEGVWVGESAAAGGATITLTLNGPERRLRFGNPRSCNLGLEAPSAPDANRRRFGIISSTGGFCDNCLMGVLSIRADGSDGDLVFAVTDLDSRTVESGRLRRSNR